MLVNLLKNWIFTLVIAIVLIAFGIVMILRPEKVVDYLLASGIVVYIILVLVDNVLHYRGKIQLFAMGELIIMAVLAVCLFTKQDIFFGKLDGVNATIGFAMYLRAFVELIHCFFLRAGEHKGRIKLSRFMIYIAFLTFGVVLIFSPLIADRTIYYIVGAFALLSGVLFAVLTYQNRRGMTKKSKKSA